MTDEELFAVDSDRVDTEADEDYSNLLTTEEKEQLDNVLKTEHLDVEEDRTGGATGRLDHELQNGNYDYLNEDFDDGFPDDDSDSHLRHSPHENGNGELPSSSSKEEKKSRWYAWGKKSVKRDGAKKLESLKMTEVLSDKGSDSGNSSSEIPRKAKQSPGLPPLDSHSQAKFVKPRRSVDGRRSVDSQLAAYENKASADRRPSNVDDLLSGKGKGKELKSGRNSTSSKELVKSKSRRGTPNKVEGTAESEYKKGLRPILWLTPDFPLKTEELLPLLDILANKVKAVRRLRELLTTKLPAGTFPVKVCKLHCTCAVANSMRHSSCHSLRVPVCTHLCLVTREYYISSYGVFRG